MPQFRASCFLTGQIVDPLERRIFSGTLRIAEGRIEAIARGPSSADGPFYVPGFVDAHVHIESSMLPPAEFARLAVVHGTVATVSDPHEIANVLGAEGVQYMLADAERTPLKIRFGAPSCVPATPFDRCGGDLGPREVARLLDNPRIGYLSEMMNYPGVLSGDADVLAKIEAAKSRGKLIDGHAPGLRGGPIARYYRAGISTDHECRTFEEGLDRLRLGMKLLIREGSAAKDFDALHAHLDTYPELCMFCSDDKHPHDLVASHINLLVKRAIAADHDLFDALQAACVNPVRHYGLNVGLLQAGDPADLIEVDNLRDWNILRVWIDGQLVAEQGVSRLERRRPAIVNRFQAPRVNAADLAAPPATGRLRVIEAIDGQLLTRAAVIEPKLAGGRPVSDPAADVLKLALVDRYSSAAPVVGFVRGFRLRRGAIASSVSHDSHNLLAVGVDDESLATALNLLVEHRGGVAVAADGISEVLPLPIAGLMSDGDGYAVAKQYSRLDALAKELGSPLTAPFMTLSFLALLVIPELKLGPCGLFDVEQFKPVGLFGVVLDHMSLASWRVRLVFGLPRRIFDLPANSYYIDRANPRALIGFGSLSVSSLYAEHTGGLQHLYIPLLAANPTLTGRGYGTAIVQHLIAESKRIFHRSSQPGRVAYSNLLFLEVYIANAVALGLYQKCQFVAVSEAIPDPEENGAPYLVMARPL